MKSLVVLLVVLVLVSAVAVAGSRAQPLPRQNPFLQICQQEPIAPESVRCRPVVLLASPGELERDVVGDVGGDWADSGDVIGGDNSDPDFWVRAAQKIAEVVWKAVVTEFVERGMNWLLGDTSIDGVTESELFDSTIFDPQL